MCQHNLPCSIIYAHCLLPGRAFASLYVLLFLEKEAEIGGRVIAYMQKLPSNNQRNQRAGGLNFATIKIVIHIFRRLLITFANSLDPDQTQQNVRSIMIILEYDICRRLLITFANSLDPDQTRQNVRSIMIILEYDIFRRLLLTFANSFDPDQAQQNVR